MKLLTLISYALIFSAGLSHAQTKDLHTKHGNVLIGPGASSNKAKFSNQLQISNNQNIPLITGDFKEARIKLNGKTGIGFSPSTKFPTNALYSNYNLFVTGGLLTDEVRVKLRSGDTWPDYVFKPDYNLATLEEIEAYINENGHLENIPTATQVAADGIDVREMIIAQQEKIEELTLHLIAQNKTNAKQSAEIAELKAIVQQLLNSDKP